MKPKPVMHLVADWPDVFTCSGVKLFNYTSNSIAVMCVYLTCTSITETHVCVFGSNLRCVGSLCSDAPAITRSSSVDGRNGSSAREDNTLNIMKLLWDEWRKAPIEKPQKAFKHSYLVFAPFSASRERESEEIKQTSGLD